jgi:L-fuculose-phosphate aldolase
MTTTEAELRENLLTLYQRLAGHGMMVGSSGNVSARFGAGMLITPTGCDSSNVQAAHMVEMRLDGGFDGARRPSSEWEMHAAIYREHEEARVIVHTHCDHATALACLNRPLPAFHYNVFTFGGEDVRCAPYVTFGTPALANLAAEAIRGRRACLLANHGMIVHGRDFAQALTSALLLETLCRQYLLTLAAGGPRLLDAAETAQAIARFTTYGRQPENLT